MTRPATPRASSAAAWPPPGPWLAGKIDDIRGMAGHHLLCWAVHIGRNEFKTASEVERRR
jgi:hypothetical protein